MMAEQSGDAIFAARKWGDDTTRDSAFVYTNNNNTLGENAVLYTAVHNFIFLHAN